MDLKALVGRWETVIRYYLNGGVNIAFGYGLFALLVALGLNLFAAQLLSHCAGVAFNYFTFSRFTFRGRAGSKVRFVLSYVFAYGFSLVTLFGVSRVVPSPYLAGFITTVFVSVCNYFVLRRLVFAGSAAS